MGRHIPRSEFKVGMVLMCGDDKHKAPPYIREDGKALPLTVIYVGDGEAELRSPNGQPVYWCPCEDQNHLYLYEQRRDSALKTWEALTVGDFVKGSYLYRILADLGGSSDLRVLCMSDAGRNNEDDCLNECGFFRTVYELKRDAYTIIQDTPDTVEINGKKYLKSAVVERLEELDPIE